MRAGALPGCGRGCRMGWNRRRRDATQLRFPRHGGSWAGAPVGVWGDASHRASRCGRPKLSIGGAGGDLSSRLLDGRARARARARAFGVYCGTLCTTGSADVLLLMLLLLLLLLLLHLGLRQSAMHGWGGGHLGRWGDGTTMKREMYDTWRCRCTNVWISLVCIRYTTGTVVYSNTAACKREGSDVCPSYHSHLTSTVTCTESMRSNQEDGVGRGCTGETRAPEGDGSRMIVAPEEIGDGAGGGACRWGHLSNRALRAGLRFDEPRKRDRS